MAVRGLRARAALLAGAVLASLSAAVLPAAATAATASESAIAVDQLVTVHRFYFPGYWDPARQADHLTATAAPPSNLYALEATFGRVSATHRTDTRAIYQCGYFGKDRTYVEHFTSHDPGCEGWTYKGVIGYIFTAPPPGYAATALHRCRVSASQEHFDSTSPTCEGQIVEFVLGYVV